MDTEPQVLMILQSLSQIRDLETMAGMQSSIMVMLLQLFSPLRGTRDIFWGK